MSRDHGPGVLHNGKLPLHARPGSAQGALLLQVVPGVLRGPSNFGHAGCRSCITRSNYAVSSLLDSLVDDKGDEKLLIRWYRPSGVMECDGDLFS